MTARKLSQAEIEVISNTLADRLLAAFKEHIGLTTVTEKDAEGNVLSVRSIDEIQAAAKKRRAEAEDREAAEYAQRRAAEDKDEMVRELMKRIERDE